MSDERPGEAALIARYFAPLAGPGAEGLRDDAASLTPTPGHDFVVTVDALVADIHFFANDPPGSIARKALGVNLSDLAAKGAQPRGYVLSLALPEDWTEAWLAGFSDGLREAGTHHGCSLLGGDTVRTGGPLTISVTAFGEVPNGTMVRRLRARPGDRLCLSGTLGDAALGLVLRREPDGPLATRLSAEARAFLLDRYLHPEPRLPLADPLRRHARSAMDVSDGLAGDLAKMLDDGISARVSVEALPLSAAVRDAIAIEPALLETALTGGDDYEILCAVAPERLDAFLMDARATGVACTAIGEIVHGNGAPIFTDADGRELSYEAGSFSHF